jgi:ATP-dependent Clp protease ATP-binding subunit ClpA
MPKINVYLPDDLAAAVRTTDLPVSAICQKALTEAVSTVTRARKGIQALRNPEFDPATHPQFASRITDRMTPRLRRALALARDASTGTARVETRHLLIGILDEHDNLAVRLLQALDGDVEELRDAATQIEVDEPLPAAPATPKADEQGPSLAVSTDEGFSWAELTLPARIAIGGALETSIDLAHNYLGCEHLLLGLLDDTTTGAGRVLQSAGVERAALRRSIVSAVAGFAQARQATTETNVTQLEQILRRLDTIERRLSAADL